MTNREMCIDRTKERFKEEIRSILLSAAALCDLDELHDIVDTVSQEVLSFLSEECAPAGARALEVDD